MVNSFSDKLSFALVAGLLLFAPLARGGAPGWAVAVIELAVLTGVALRLTAAAWNRRWGWPRTDLDLPILALTGLLLISATFSIDSRRSIQALVRFAAYVGVYYLTVLTIRDWHATRRLLTWIISISSFLGVFAIIKGAGFNPFPCWEYTDLYPETLLVATFGNHNHLAGWLEMAIPLLLATFFERRWRKRLSVQLLLLALLVAVLVLGQSRGGWLGFLAGVSFLTGLLLVNPDWRRQHRWILSFLAGIALAAGLLVISSPVTTGRLLTVKEGIADLSLAGRPQVWMGVVKMISANPWLGTGPGTFNEAYPGYQLPGLIDRYPWAHNDYLEFAAELGLSFWAVMLWLLVVLYRQGLRKFRAGHSGGFVALGALTGITSILAHSLVDFNLQIPANALLFTVLAGLVAGKQTSGQADRLTG